MAKEETLLFLVLESLKNPPFNVLKNILIIHSCKFIPAKMDHSSKHRPRIFPIKVIITSSLLSDSLPVSRKWKLTVIVYASH